MRRYTGLDILSKSRPTLNQDKSAEEDPLTAITA
jgi:hypothetical protein